MNQTIKLAGVAVVGAGVGFVVGFKVAEKKMLSRFDERLAEETRDMREFYETVRKPYASPEEAVADLIPPPENKDPRTNGNRVQYNKVVPQQDKRVEPEEELIPKAPPVVQNIFEGPRIITQEEFMANDTSPAHVQATLTYYEKSDQVCGEADEPIENSDIVVGIEFKDHFGKDSSDPNVVHVRNDGLHMDFEVVKSEGSYEEEVLGQTTDESLPPHKRVRLEGR